MSQLTLYNAPSPLPDRPQLRQERHFCRNQNQRSSSPVVGGLFTDPRSSSGPRKLALLTALGKVSLRDKEDDWGGFPGALLLANFQCPVGTFGGPGSTGSLSERGLSNFSL